MKISFLPSKHSTEVRPVHCPDCGERLRNVVLDCDECTVKGVKFRCKRCGKFHELNVETTKSK